MQIFSHTYQTQNCGKLWLVFFFLFCFLTSHLRICRRERQRARERAEGEHEHEWERVRASVSTWGEREREKEKEIWVGSLSICSPGMEPTTFWSRGWCSNQLSHRARAHECVLTSPPSNCDACSSLRTTGFMHVYVLGYGVYPNYLRGFFQITLQANVSDVCIFPSRDTEVLLNGEKVKSVWGWWRRKYFWNGSSVQ